MIRHWYGDHHPSEALSGYEIAQGIDDQPRSDDQARLHHRRPAQPIRGLDRRASCPCGLPLPPPVFHLLVPEDRLGLKEVAVSSGSACTSASVQTSHVLRAMGLGDALAHASVRFGLGRGNTEEEVDYVCNRLVEEVTRLRAMSPLSEPAR